MEENIFNKYSLPTFEELDKEFEISAIDEECFSLKRIVEKIYDTIDKYIPVLEGILQPDGSSYSALYEFKAFDDKDKKEVFEIYRKLMIALRESSVVMLENNKDKEAGFINIFYKDWKDIKTKLLKFFNKLKDSWNHDLKIEEKQNYLG